MGNKFWVRKDPAVPMITKIINVQCVCYCVAWIKPDGNNLREEGSFGVSISKGPIHYIGEGMIEWELTSEWTRRGMGEYRKRLWQDAVSKHLQTLT